MTPAEYRSTLSRLGLSQVAAARVMGIDPRTSRRYALGETPIPKIVENLLDILRAQPIHDLAPSVGP